MSAYTSPSRPEVRQTERRGEWELCEALFIFHGPLTWCVPQGFRFDFASVPRFVRPLIQTTDLGTAGPCSHDYLYRNGGHIGSGLRYTRAEADELFRELMATDCVPWWRRVPAYHAVRHFGERAWQERATGRAA